MRKLIKFFIICISIFKCIAANTIRNGCNAYDCKRNCLNSEISETPGDNGFKFEIDGVIDKYMPEKTYKINLSGSRNKATNTINEFRGFLIVSVPETWYDAMPFFPMGQFKISPNDREVRYTSGCSEMLTHTHFEPKTSLEFHWTAPKSGSGCISLKAFVIQTETLWLKDDGQLTRTLCESDEMNEKNEVSKCCACGEAKYSLLFKGNWNKQNFPKDWPSNEGLTHWSNLIGATHSRNYTLWEYGGLASPGLKELAEFGIIRTLEGEIKNHSNYNVIRNIVTANGLWFPNVDKETTSTFTVSNNYHLFSFATMLGPSPDWLSGLSKLDLCLPNCTWLESFSENLFLFDAGTDSGLSYNSPNKPMVPQEKIRKITTSFPNNPQSPFYDPNNKEMTPFAKLTLKRTMLRGPQCPNNEVETSNQKIIDPAEFDPKDYSDPLRRKRLLDSESNVISKKSRSKSSKMIFLDQTEPKCMTTEWSEWTKCSSECGNGLRKRSRHYKDPKLAMNGCNELLDDNEMCLSENGECETDQEETEIDSSQICLMVSKWSSWSPCSASCGKGTTIRKREFLKKVENCSTKLIEYKPCMVTERCLDESLMSSFERKRICMMDKKPGPCRMTKKNTRFYFDRQMKKCLSFEYGGCRGNENNFKTIDQCENICSIMLTDKMDNNDLTKSNQMNEKSMDEEISMKKKICLLPREEGLCHESQIKYYFDRTKLMCAPFEYSGCEGNKNNFATLNECESSCHQIINFVTDEEKNSARVMDLTMPEKKKICMSPAEKGTCSETIQRYSYNVNMAKCLPFIYSGCEGNLNNFETVQDCEKACDILIQMSRQASISEEEANLEMQKKAMCMLNVEKGPCMNYQERFFFDTSIGKCATFTYGGCFGNNNNFESLEECETTCHYLIQSAMTMAEKSMSINMVPNELSFQERKNLCRLPINEGSCYKQLKRFHFNFYTQECEPFIYTGCDGNENNFITEKDCLKKCSNLNKNFTAEAMKMSNNTAYSSMLPSNCMISEWNTWSICTANECGKKGISFRSRMIISEGKYGGKECPKNLNETRICYKKCDPMRQDTTNCVVGKWSSWSECKQEKSCDDGFQERFRQIIKHPQNNGKECPKLYERRKCFLGSCMQFKIKQN